MEITLKAWLGAGFVSLGLLAAGAAAAQDALTVYTPQEAPQIEVLEKAAEAALGFDINFVLLGGGAVYDRVLAEKNNPQADVVYGMIPPLMAGLKQQGLLEKYESKSAIGLPDHFKDKDGYYYSYRQTPLALSYNADVMTAEQAPKSWLDLSKPEYKGKFVMPGLTAQTARGILAGLFTRFLDANGEVTEAGWTWMGEFFANAVVLQQGMERPKMVASGETPISLNHFQGVQRDAVAGGYTYAFVNTEGGTPNVAESNGVLKGTDQYDRAVAFIDFASSVDWQVTAAEQFGIIPAHPDAIARAPKDVAASATLLDTQPIDWDLMAAKLSGWLERVQLELL